MTTYLESSDDGYINYFDGSYSSTNDYVDAGSGDYCVIAHRQTASGGAYSYDTENRAYKRFILGLGAGDTVTEAILYWYLDSIPNNSAQKSCNLEQINDYLTLGSSDWGITVKHDYGAVMDYNESPGWKSQDVTTEIEASKEDAYVAFRWKIATAPAAGSYQTFYIRAYDYTAYKAYLAITLSTGWPHARTGVANANIGSITGVAKASIGSITGVS